MTERFAPSKRLTVAGVTALAIAVVVAIVFLTTGNSGGDDVLSIVTPSSQESLAPADDPIRTTRPTSSATTREVIGSGPSTIVETTPDAISVGVATTLADGDAKPTTSPPTTSLAPNPTPAPPAPPRSTQPTPPQAVITLTGREPEVGTFAAVTLNVSSSDGSTPGVSVVQGACHVDGAGSPSPFLSLNSPNLADGGVRCTVRASGEPLPGFVRAADQDLTITWMPVVGYVRLEIVERAPSFATVKVTTTNVNIHGASQLLYSPANQCSGPSHAGRDEVITVMTSVACTITGKSVMVNQTVLAVVETLVIPPP